MPEHESNGRTHEPSLRELTAELDGAKGLLLEKIEALQNIIDERDRLYKERDDARKTAVDAALAAAKEAVSAALLAADRAVAKVETANEKRFEAVNEFRGQLADQAATFLPRGEANILFSGLSEKIEGLRTEIQSLRESRSGNVAVEKRETAATQRTQWSTGVIISTILGSIAVVLSFAAVLVLLVRHP